MLDQDLASVAQFHALAKSILCRSQPAALVEAKLQPSRFKITPRKIRSVILFPSLFFISHLNGSLLYTVDEGLEKGSERKTAVAFWPVLVT